MGLEISIGKGFVPQPDGTVWSYSQSASHVTLQKWTGAYPDGELASEADVTYERYAQFRREFPGLGLPELVPPGNTIGRVVGEVGTASVPASQANPPVGPETEEEKGFWSRWGGKILDGTQLTLDGVGLIPGVGEIADGANALISLGRGDYAGAALSAAAMIPFAGWGATGAKLGRKGVQAAEATAKAGKEAAEQAGKHADDAAAAGGKKGNDGGKVKGTPCDHLRKGNPRGKGKYRGGAHSHTGKPANDGKDSHHMPADVVSPLPKRDGPAIQMDPADHRRTSSNGNQGLKGALYREKIKEMISSGKWRDAIAREIKDIRRIVGNHGDSRKYNEAMKEMLRYFHCLEMHGIL